MNAMAETISSNGGQRNCSDVIVETEENWPYSATGPVKQSPESHAPWPRKPPFHLLPLDPSVFKVKKNNSKPSRNFEKKNRKLEEQPAIQVHDFRAHSQEQKSESCEFQGLDAAPYVMGMDENIHKSVSCAGDNRPCDMGRRRRFKPASNDIWDREHVLLMMPVPPTFVQADVGHNDSPGPHPSGRLRREGIWKTEQSDALQNSTDGCCGFQTGCVCIQGSIQKAAFTEVKRPGDMGLAEEVQASFYCQL